MEEKKKNGFECSNCKRFVEFSKYIGTKHRNHCPFCLWSFHLDDKKSGDRKAICEGQMVPLGLTFKQEGLDKYGKKKQGELMLVHECQKCLKISINRIAGDDDHQALTEVFEGAKKNSPEKVEQLKKEGIELLSEKDKAEVFLQLFGEKTNEF